MRVILKSLLLSFFVFQFLFADGLQDKFNAGNQYYQNGQYEQAIAQYISIHEAGFESGELYFNLGNAYYKLGQYGLAHLNYQRAKRFLKNDDALNTNIALLKQMLVDKIPVPPRFFLSFWWDTLIDFVNMALLSWITIVLLATMLLLFALRRHALKRGKPRQFRAVFITSITLFVLSALIYTQKIYKLETEQFGIILKPSVTVFAEPNASGTEVFVLHEGTKVEIGRLIDEWFEIKLEDGKTGWLAKDNLEII